MKTRSKVKRSAERAAKAFQKWNTSNQGATPQETQKLQHLMHMAFLRLMQNIGVNPSKFPSWRESLALDAKQEKQE